MAKENGLGGTYTVDDSAGSGQDISNDVTNATFSTPRALLDVTGIDVSSMERLAGIADGQATLNGVFNSADNLSHDVFKNIANNTATRTVALAHSGQTLTMESYFGEYTLTRAADGSLNFTAAARLATVASYGWS